MEPLEDLEFGQLLPGAPFTELHRRTIDAGVDEVWVACLSVTAGEVRAVGPLFALRGLPRRLLRRTRPPTLAPERSLLDGFVAENFVLLRRDPVPVDGRAIVVLGAAGRFWSPAHNPPVRFSGPLDFLDFDDPGHAKTVFRLEATVQADGQTAVVTETRVVGTDRQSTRRFAPYWALIRLPSGWIRRSWLAAIDRRVSRR